MSWRRKPRHNFASQIDLARKPVTFQTGAPAPKCDGLFENLSQLNKENENPSNFPAHPQLQKVMGFSKAYGIVMGSHRFSGASRASRL